MAKSHADRWESHAKTWRDPSQVIGFVGTAPALHPDALEAIVAGPFWDLLAAAGMSLLVSREYEHLLVHLSAPQCRPRTTFLQVPHPSGLAFDVNRSTVHVACTRNPNQVLDLAPVSGYLDRTDSPAPAQPHGTLLPTRSRYYPGSLYLHDLALIGGELYGNAVAHNAVVRLPDTGGFERAWWPRSVESATGPDFTANHVQLNSIAAAPSLAQSWFTASGSAPGHRRPGDPAYPVDGLGVAFDGRTRSARVRGLTRPHSARLHDGALWLDNSGYGELRRVADPSAPGDLEADVVATLPGWTRGLALIGDLAFVGTSRVIPRFAQYAPGLDVATSTCGIQVVDTRSGVPMASLTWPAGNQIFAIEVLPASFAAGLPGGLAGGHPQPAGPDFYYAATTNQETP